MTYFLISDNSKNSNISNNLLIGSAFMIINKFIYSLISIKAIPKFLKKENIIILIIFMIPPLGILPLIDSFLINFSTITIIIGVLSTLTVFLAFIKCLANHTIANTFFLIGLFILIIADIFNLYNKFVSYELYMVIIYNIIYYVSWLLICISMIKQKSLSK